MQVSKCKCRCGLQAFEGAGKGMHKSFLQRTPLSNGANFYLFKDKGDFGLAADGVTVAPAAVMSLCMEWQPHTVNSIAASVSVLPSLQETV